MKVVVTGAAGFLGWHTRVRLTTLQPAVQVVPLDRAAFEDDTRLHQALDGAEAVLHLAGINRADPEQVEHGNIRLADRLAQALTSTGARPRVGYAGSTQADTDTPYGRGKRAAGSRLAEWGQRCGAGVQEVRLPGLYGEHGRPDYNSFVATFAHRIAEGTQPQVTGDREVPLLHVQDAAGALIDSVLAPSATPTGGEPAVLRPSAPKLGISWVRNRLTTFRDVYATGEIPDLTSAVDVSLFNTLRAALWRHRTQIPLTPRTDPRGSLVEVVRQHGGQGQTFFSTSHPGVRRGDHFHLHKIERFVVLAGTGVIRLRRMLTDDVVQIPVDGRTPVAVDMPTLWTHSIENTGTEPLLTMFWVNELFDPDNPDTHPEPVLQPAVPEVPR